MAHTLTLSGMLAAAQTMGIPAEMSGLGGNVVGMPFTVNGAHALFTLGDGVDEDSTWNVSLDSDTREEFGYVSADDLPVSSDEEGTMADAIAWVRHAVWGDTVGDGASHGYGCGH